MNKVWVFNASPLIFLCKINQIELLEKLNVDILIPQAVADEINDGDNDDKSKKWINSKGNKFIINTDEINKIVLHWDLGSGESAVISHCLEKNNYYAILDDLAARKCAETLSIKVKGTLGILLLAKKKGLINSVKPLLDQLKDNHCRINKNLYDMILRKASESI